MFIRRRPARVLALVSHLFLAGLAWVYIGLVVVVSGGLTLNVGESGYTSTVILFAVVVVGIPTLIYSLVLRRWWRTGRWWALGAADVAIASLAGWIWVGRDTGIALIAGVVALAAALGAVAVVATGHDQSGDVPAR